MKLITSSQRVKLKEFTMDKGEMFVFPDYQAAVFEQSNIKFQIVKINEILNEFKGGARQVVIIRTGGIGDLLALSSLCKYIYENHTKTIKIVSQKKYADIFKWFEVPIIFNDFYTPLGINDLKFRLKKPMDYLFYEGIIENSNENWFHLFFKNFEVDFNYWGRPFLKDISVRDKDIDILLTLKSTSKVRSFPFEPVYMALRKHTNRKISVHKSNLTIEDINFINSLPKNSVDVIELSTLKSFLNDVAIAKMVVSTDTAALHFREGLKLSAIGLYNAFSAECRTKYYQYTKSYDIKSNCPKQPCFLHTKTPTQNCSNFNQFCINSQTNPLLINQLNDILWLE